MDIRDAIAVPATIAFVVLGFYGIVDHRLQMWRRRAGEEDASATPSKWRRLPPAARLRRRLMGVILGAVAAMLLLVLAQHIIHAFSL